MNKIEKIIKIIGSIIILILSIIIAYADYKDDKYIKYILTAINLIILFFVTDIFNIIIDLVRSKKRKQLFESNKNICKTSLIKYGEYIDLVSYSENEEISIKSIINNALLQHYNINDVTNIDEKNGIRIVFLFTFHQECEDSIIRADIFNEIKDIISQYNLRSQSKSNKILLDTIALYFNYTGRSKKQKSLDFLKGISPFVEFYEIEKQLKQLTRFKDFIKSKFSNKFNPKSVLNDLQEKGKNNCYWIVVRRIDDAVRDYIKSHPILATKPANSHNFPSLRSVRFSHYLIRVNDYKIKNANDLKNKISSLTDANSQMLLFIYPIQSKQVELIEPAYEDIKDQYYTNIAKTTLLYFSTGLLEIPEDTADFEKAVNSGKITLNEIVEILPLSFLIKKTDNFNYDLWDKIGNIIKKNLNINSITEWKDFKYEDLYKQLRSITEPTDVTKFIKSITKKKLENICKNIIKSAKQLSDNLNL